MIYLGIFLLCVNVVLWIFLYLRLDKRFNAAALLESIGDEVSRITLEINKATDISITLMDARKTELRELLSQVERQMALANESMDRMERMERIEGPEQSDRTKDAGYLFPTAPPRAGETAPPIVEPLTVSTAEPVSLRQRARSLAATGLSDDAIADTLGISVVEVELYTL